MVKIENNNRMLLCMLKQEVNTRNGRSQGLSLPNAVNFQLLDNGWKIELGAQSVCKNLQTDDAAFEGWALIIKNFFGSNKEFGIYLDWDSVCSKDLHYQRFLYRVIRFREAFYWFHVSDRSLEHLDDSRVLNINGSPKGKFLLNKAGARECKENAKSTEAKIECKFIKSPEKLLGCIGIAGKLQNQIPVGIFSGLIKKGHEVFPRGKSAIDLAVVDDVKGVAIFELKIHNTKVGAISEILFYSHIIKDIQSGILIYDDNIQEFDNKLSKAQMVQAFILADRLHPLLNNPGVFHLLNSVYAKKDIKFGYINYDDKSLRCEIKYPKP